MIFGLFRRSSNVVLIGRLHGEIMAAARQPALFDAFGIADTVEGRFEALALMSSLALGRLMQLPAPAPELAQELTDEIFSGLDIALREIGVSDAGVSKRMKKMAQGFLGRAEAYRIALSSADQDQLEKALARNVYGGDATHAGRLAAYVRQCQVALAECGMATYLKGPLPFPPAMDVEGTR
jgi:cytochrome b pre-mRNA-processing protein 3